MDNFSKILLEARKKYDSESLLSSEVQRFLTKVNKVIPATVKDVIFLTQKYNLLDKDSIEEIRTSSKSSLKKLGQKYNIGEDDIESLYKQLKDLKSNIYLLPQYMSPQEREMLELGKLSMNDLTIDLESSQGRTAATKVYMPMIYKIVSQHVGKSSLSRAELISAATEGFVNAMNDWDRSTGVPFKTYAGLRVRQQILNDMNHVSHSLSGYNSYAFSKGYSADALSLDGMLGMGEDGDYKQDRLAALGTTDDEYSEIDDRKLKPIYDLLDRKFSTRDIDIFCRIFALKGTKKESGRDIAKSYGMDESNITQIKNKILKFLRNDPKALQILKSLHESYNISLMAHLCGLDRATIMEALINDDMFILLEELNKWADSDSFKFAFESSLKQLSTSDSKCILDIVKRDFDFLDGTFKKCKKTIILFLSYMYPTETMNRKSDVSLLEYMVEIQEAYKKHFK